MEFDTFAQIVIYGFLALLFVSVGMQLATWRYDPEEVKNHWREVLNRMFQEFSFIYGDVPPFELKPTKLTEMREEQAVMEKAKRRISEPSEDELITFDEWHDQEEKRKNEQ